MMLRAEQTLLTAAIVLAVAACRTEQTLVTPDPHLERMLVQEKILPYGESSAFPNGMAMQQPPYATVATDTLVGRPLEVFGAADGILATRIPIPVDRKLVYEGQRHFDLICAVCHGILGDGESVVAGKMALRRPPSLLDARIRACAPGRLYEAIRQGYGLMPSYAAELSPDEAWGVVAYVHALQIARGVPVGMLPPESRASLAKEAL